MAKTKPKATKAKAATVKGAKSTKTQIDANPETVADLMESAEPVQWSPALGMRIIKQMSEGSTIADITAQRNYPHRSTLCRWARKYPSFGEAFAGAKLLQGDSYKDEVRNLVDRVDRDDVSFQKARVMMDGLQWLAAVTNPAYQKQGKTTAVQVNVNNEVSRDRVSKLGKGKRLEAEALYSSLVDGDGDVSS